MPKAKRKSIGRKFKGGSNANQVLTPSEEPEEMPSQPNDNIIERLVTTDVEMESLDDSNLEIDFNNIQPGPSGLQTNVTANSTVSTEQEVPEQIVIEPFELSGNDRAQLFLSRMERRTVKAFMEHNIEEHEEQYEWPVESEHKDDA